MPYPSGRSDQARRVVLLIDEDPKIGHLVRLSLHGPQCQVLATSRFAEGMKMAARFRPDLILMDTRFSDADGLEVAEKIRQTPETRYCGIVFLTAQSGLLTEIGAVQLGALDVLQKPIEGRELSKRVDAIFARLLQGQLPDPVVGPGVKPLRQAIRQVLADTATGALILKRPGQMARMSFSRGELQIVECGLLRAEEATGAIARQGDWEVMFEEGEQKKLAGPSLGLQPEPALESGAFSRPGPPRDKDEPTIRESIESEEDETDKLPALSAQPNESWRIESTRDREISEEDETAPLAFSGDAVAAPRTLSPAAVGDPAADRPDRVRIQRWLQEMNASSLLLLVPDESIRIPLQRAAERLGYSIVSEVNGVDGYSKAVEHRPVAMICDLQIPDMDGRDLVKAVRTDFRIRETPVILISSESLAARVRSHGPDAEVGPIIEGVEAALAPRVSLFNSLAAGESGVLGGLVEPIGATNLLHLLGAARFSGRLRLSKQDRRNAEVLFSNGEICGATVDVPTISVGPLAMLQVVGYDWEDYSLSPAPLEENRVSLGRLDQLTEDARLLNNQLLSLLYHQGVKIEDVAIDSDALDLFLQTLAPSQLEILIRLVEGEPAAALVREGVAGPALTKSMLCELRRKAVISPISMRPLQTGQQDLSEQSQAGQQVRGGSRWLVAVLAGAVTILLAAGGYLVYWHIMR